MTNTHFKPEGYASVSPYLIVTDAQVVIDFLATVFDAKPLRRYERPDGSVMHAEVLLDDTVVMLGESTDEWTSTPCTLHVYVPDVDAAFKRAVDAGATVIHDPMLKDDDPDLRGGFVGPGGNQWWVSTQVASES